MKQTESQKPEYIFDIHSHACYGVDDGARTQEEAVELLRMAAAQGVRAMILTPHSSGKRKLSRAQLEEQLKVLQDSLTAQCIHMALYIGSEILFYGSVPEELQSGAVQTMAGSFYVLVEFPEQASYQSILTGIRSLTRSGYMPILAHAERYPVLYRQGVQELLESGACIQLSLQAVGASWLQPATRFCRRLLKHGEVQFVGSDLHRLDSRPPVLEQGARWIRRNLSKEEADAVLYRNAEAMVKNIPLQSFI